MKNKSNAVPGVIIGNRDFFPDKLVAEAKAEIIDLFTKLSITPVMLTDEYR
jgi:L-fucose isomerase-like protein